MLPVRAPIAATAEGLGGTAETGLATLTDLPRADGPSVGVPITGAARTDMGRSAKVGGSARRADAGRADAGRDMTDSKQVRLALGE
jgi:hypothetical protein